MKYLLSIFFLFLFLGVEAQIQTEVPTLNYEELEVKIGQEKDKTLVVNFWSTTCAPCVKELPHFMEVNEQFKENKNYKMLLVTLDRVKDMPRVLKFLQDKNIEAEVVLLNDIKRMNTWIPRFDQDWGGEIPVTVFYKNGEKVHFNNGEMSKEELENTIKQYL